LIKHEIEEIQNKFKEDAIIKAALIALKLKNVNGLINIFEENRVIKHIQE
jgi:hypothetical protein